MIELTIENPEDALAALEYLRNFSSLIGGTGMEYLNDRDKMEFIIQKMVELGVYEIIPVAMKYCVVKLDEKKAANKVKRWQAISESAAKQSKRSIVPKIHPVMSFREAAAYAGTCDLCLVPYENERGMNSALIKEL